MTKSYTIIRQSYKSFRKHTPYSPPTKKQIIIIWISLHKGIEGNKKADSLAKEATDQTNESNIPTPHQDLLTTTTKAEREEWKRIWTTANKSKIHDVAHHFYQKMPNNSMSRREIIAMTRLRIGHTRITHEYLLAKTESPFCNTCNQT